MIRSDTKQIGECVCRVRTLKFVLLGAKISLAAAQESRSSRQYASDVRVGRLVFVSDLHGVSQQMRRWISDFQWVHTKPLLDLSVLGLDKQVDTLMFILELDEELVLKILTFFDIGALAGD